MKYTLTLTEFGILNMHWATLDDEHIEQLETGLEDGEDASTLEEILWDGLDDNWNWIIDGESFDESENFNLKVTDETGKVVYESNNPRSIFYDFREDLDEDFEEKEMTIWPDHGGVPEIPDGVTLISLETREGEGFTLTGEFETDTFDVSKLRVFSNPGIPEMFFDPNADLDRLYYGDQHLKMEQVDDDDCHDSSTRLYKLTVGDGDMDLEEIE